MSTRSIITDIADTVHHKRFLKQWSQDELAKYAGVSKGTVYGLESCRTKHFDNQKEKNVTIESVYKITKALGLNMKVVIA